MRFNLVTTVWIVFLIFLARMAFRMWDGGAEFLDYVKMGAIGLTLAALISVASYYYKRNSRRPFHHT